MVFHVLNFTVKIERTQVSPERRIAELKRSQYLKEREEAHAVQAASYPDFVSRM